MNKLFSFYKTLFTNDTLTTVESLKESNNTLHNELGYASSDNVAGNNHTVDYKEIKSIVQSVVA